MLSILLAMFINQTIPYLLKIPIYKPVKTLKLTKLQAKRAALNETALLPKATPLEALSITTSLAIEQMIFK